ncbi:hypothetical protein PHAVU_007G190200 [Phaseolus vulgaris]|uniref:Uncharacterized protein n=1 Tax=Phaseolus vulgaris TaxID=3885 RepID=V7BG43_PHAVU|nr:hypothetical protein PHAVU_007G190200g [Phaseolus vulgaris]ESW16854.1 hypothetical protein PHAVU_007G190200g [Phaseolus vulgaris]
MNPISQKIVVVDEFLISHSRTSIGSKEDVVCIFLLTLMDFISGVRASDYAIAAPHAKASATNGLGNLMVSLSTNALFYFFV